MNRQAGREARAAAPRRSPAGICGCTAGASSRGARGCAGGEVDIVARRGRTLAFVEVKARASEEAAAFALDEWRLRRVAAAAERLAPRYMRDGDDVRIDAMFIVPRPLAAPSRQRLARVTKLATRLTRAVDP